MRIRLRISERYQPLEIDGTAVSTHILVMSEVTTVLLFGYLAAVHVATYSWEVRPVIARWHLVPVVVLAPAGLWYLSRQWRLVRSIGEQRQSSDPRWLRLARDPQWPRYALPVIVIFGIQNQVRAMSYRPIPESLVVRNSLFYEETQRYGVVPISEAEYLLAQVQEVKALSGFLLAFAAVFMVLALWRNSLLRAEARSSIIESFC